MTSPFPITRRLPRHGSALIITLTFLSLMCVLLVAFVSSMRSDVTAARFHLSGVRAEFYAQEAADIALARLRIANTNGSWVSQPGRIIAVNTNNTAELVIDLSSGTPTLGADSTVAADLNPKSFQSSASRLVVATNSPMPVKWIYVRRNGTRDTTVPPTVNASNPVIGRYAFWVDDESARLNINTAWKRSTANTAAASHPSKVDLTTLFLSSDADRLRTYRTSTHSFDSVDEARVLSSDVSDAIDRESFSLTAYNHSPELNIFGEPRIVLTTRKSRANGAPFIDILTTDTADPALIANIDKTKVATVVKQISDLLRRKNWPFLTGKSFEDKFKPTRPEQIALNIIEYVRAAESNGNGGVVEPLNGNLDSGAFALSNSSSDTAMMGNSRGPRITEMGIFTTKTANSSGKWPLSIKVEVYLPANANVPSVDLTALYLGVQSDVAFGTQKITAAETGNAPILLPGQYRVITRSELYTSSARPWKILLRATIKSGSTGNPPLDWVQLKGSGWMTYTFDGTSVTEDKITTWQADDPYVNRFKDDWGTVQKPNTLGAANTTTVGTTPTLTLAGQQDTDANGNLTDVGIKFPAPSGSATNPDGIVQSVGELGSVHTGTECVKAGIPYRTIRLQPQKSGATELPDWALLDLFAVPSTATTTEQTFSFPGGQPGGRININAGVRPFTDSSGAATFTRFLPLQSLLLNASRDGSSQLNLTDTLTISKNIAALSPVLATGLNAGKAYGTHSVFYSPGQLAEIAGVADKGEASEALLHEICSLGTVRGNVFSIYTIGQSLTQDKAGAIRVTAERRQVTTVERTVTSTTGDTGAFQTVSFRELKP